MFRGGTSVKLQRGILADAMGFDAMVHITQRSSPETSITISRASNEEEALRGNDGDKSDCSREEIKRPSRISISRVIFVHAS